MGRHIESAENKSFKQRIVYPVRRFFKNWTKKIEKHKTYKDWDYFHYQTLHNKNIKVLHTETLENSS